MISGESLQAALQESKTKMTAGVKNFAPNLYCSG